jgi:hypothetical protein
MNALRSLFNFFNCEEEQAEIRNPGSRIRNKPEFRNPKAIRSSKSEAARRLSFPDFEPSHFGFLSDLGFRTSDFGRGPVAFATARPPLPAR